MNKKYIKVIVPVLILVEFSFLFLAYKSYSNKEIEKVVESNEISKEKFAMYKENEEGTYEPYNGTVFPTGYTLDKENSICVDNNEQEIADILSFSNNQLTITSNKTSYCYLYFKKMSIGEYLINTPTAGLVTSETYGNLYRYQGTSNVNNFICFGISDITNCKKNTEKYLYRIIGIDETGKLKLIKNEALPNQMMWSSSNGNVEWPDSLLKNEINGSAFYENSNYVPSDWKSKIALSTWKYGDINVNLYNETGIDVYNKEIALGSEINAYIGLMYIHDVLLAYDADYTGTEIPSDAWLSYNSTLMPRAGLVDVTDNIYYGWFFLNGKIDASTLSSTRNIHPVFYLTADINLEDGNGTIDNPFIIN